MERWTVAQYREYLDKQEKPKRVHKYNAKKTVVDGITFDSAKEAAKYSELLLLQRVGEIVKIELQPVFVIVPQFEDRQGKKHRQTTYVADFRVTYKGGRVVVIDTKGFKTQVYMVKIKMFREKYPDIEFIEC